MNSKLIILTYFLLLLGCEQQNDSPRAAKVGNQILYKSDVEKMIPSGMVGSDSVSLASNYIEKWVREKLLLRTAEMNLSEAELDVEELVANYRTSLIVSNYKQKYINQKLDTLVTMDQAAEYQAKYPDNFLLDRNLYKFILARVTLKNWNDLSVIRRMFKEREIDVVTREVPIDSTSYLVSYTDSWYSLSEIQSVLPEGTVEAINNVKFEVKDENYIYLVAIVEERKKGEVAPIEYAFEKAREIILHKRKIKQIKQIEDKIYEDAKRKGDFETY